jgi:ATP-dependent Lon protease
VGASSALIKGQVRKSETGDAFRESNGQIEDIIQIMKDYMANGRFSRGVEVIADASLAFVGNIDQSIEHLVNSSQHDLFLPLPRELDLAVMDRFAC